MSDHSFNGFGSITQAISGLYCSENTCQHVCEQVVQLGQYDFAAVQICHPSEQVIETVWAHGLAKEWEGRAKHFLEKNEGIRDVEADIALANPPRIEVITGNDERYDEWIVETYRSPDFVSVFVPVILARDAYGNVLTGTDLQQWIDSWKPIPDSKRSSPEKRHVVEIGLPDTGVSWIIIGTIEAGYEDYKKRPGNVDAAFELARTAARLAIQLHRTQLDHVFQCVVNHALQLGGAMYASLHFDGSKTPIDDQHIGYVYQVFSGRVTKHFLKHHPPRIDGLGSHAILQHETLIADDLQLTNRDVFKTGIHAMAAVPLSVECSAPICPVPPRSQVGPMQGVLYVGFGGEPPRDGRERLSPEVKERLEQYAGFAVDAIRQATAYAKLHDHDRLLASLHSVAEQLIRDPEAPLLLGQIAGSVRNILGADIVTIYECDGIEGRVYAQPAIAGRLFVEGSMHTEVSDDDVPALLLKHGAPIHADTYPDAEAILDNPHRKRPESKGEPFSKREKIVSGAGIPLKFANKTVGLLFINYRRPYHFSEDIRKIIEMLASSAAIAIRNRRILEMRSARSSEILTSVNLPEVFRGLLHRALELTGASFGEIRVLDNLTGELGPAFAYPGDDKMTPEQCRSRLDGIALGVKERGPIYMHDSRFIPGFVEAEIGSVVAGRHSGPRGTGCGRHRGRSQGVGIQSHVAART